jgi:serine protease
VVPLLTHPGGITAPLLGSPNNLRYGGGIDGVGVTTGAPKVYLVFWGSQWGSQSTNAQGNITLSGDPKGTAPYLEAFMKGIGTGGETWSGVMTQYCQNATSGSQTCPSTAASHVGYPTGGAFAGVWVDESSAAPQQANGNQLGAEAVNAATHFGNNTQASNRNTQYVIISPTGTNPDGFNTLGSDFCAWHDYTGDSSLSGGAVNSPDGQLAFTNLPYITDAGGSCGQNFVNSGSAGTLDGVSIVEGHEHAETITDQFPAGGWTDVLGQENGDKCAWISSGQGAAQNITLSTGTFAVQSTWANDFGGGSGDCEISHPIETG